MNTPNQSQFDPNAPVTMGMLGEVAEQITNGILGNLKQSALQQQKKLDEFQTEKKVLDDKLSAFDNETDAINKDRAEQRVAIIGLHEPKLNELREKAQAQVDDKVETFCNKIGNVVGKVTRPIQAAAQGVKEGATR